MENELKNECYYWVLWGDRWRIAEWFDGEWWFTGSEVPKAADAVDTYEGPITRATD